MPTTLTRPANAVTTAPGSPYRPMLEKLQGNILKSHGRNAERHVFLTFTGPQQQVRGWISNTLAPRLLTAAKQFDDAAERDAAKRRGDPPPDGGLSLLFFLSAEGYRYLGFDPRQFDSKSFRRGMKDQRSGLLEEALSTDNLDPPPAQWEAGFQPTIHAMVLLGDDAENETGLLNELQLLQIQIAGLAQIAGIEIGRALRRIQRDGQQLVEPEPIEHFGYFDGISQPLFTADDLAKYAAEHRGTPGGTNWDPSASLDLVLVDDPFADDEEAFGSYLVYRKLHQHLGRWKQHVADLAAAAALNPDLAGALAVGRFKDGTPVVGAKQAGGAFTNDFVFKRDDPDGTRCPIHAHIRKVNPRGTTPRAPFQSSEERNQKERRRRIARRAIPYGKPERGISDAAQTDEDQGADRGLLFMCFQSNVERQFEFIQRTWVDNPNFPSNVVNLPGIVGGVDTGDDPLIGQDRNEPQRWPQTWGDGATKRKKFNFDSAVTLKGGEYFFAPSKPFLAAL